MPTGAVEFFFAAVGFAITGFGCFVLGYIVVVIKYQAMYTKGPH